MKYLNEAQISSILDDASNLSTRDYLVFITLLKTGLRASELISLRVHDINLVDNSMHVMGKGRKIRTIKIPPALSQLLNIYIKQNNIKRKDKLFPFDRSTIYRITEKIASINPHGLRHTYAIHLLRKTGNIRYVQKQLGHSKLTSTEIYLQFIEFDQEDQKLASLFI